VIGQKQRNWAVLITQNALSGQRTIAMMV